MPRFRDEHRNRLQVAATGCGEYEFTLETGTVSPMDEDAKDGQVAIVCG